MVIDSEVVSGGSVIHSQGDAISLGNLKLMDHNLIPFFLSFFHFPNILSIIYRKISEFIHISEYY